MEETEEARRTLVKKEEVREDGVEGGKKEISLGRWERCRWKEVEVVKEEGDVNNEGRRKVVMEKGEDDEIWI